MLAANPAAKLRQYPGDVQWSAGAAGRTAESAVAESARRAPDGAQRGTDSRCACDVAGATTRASAPSAASATSGARRGPNTRTRRRGANMAENDRPGQLSDIAIQRGLGALPGWSRRGDMLSKTFQFE